MAWVAITSGMVETVLSGPELEAVRRVAGDAAGNDDDKLATVIGTVTDECRAKIEDCGENRLGAAGTLPERVHHHALAIIRQRLLTRLDLGVSEGRAAEYREALRFFDRVSECKVKIEAPDDEEVVTEAARPTVSVLNSGPTGMKRENIQGLF